MVLKGHQNVIVSFALVVCFSLVGCGGGEKKSSEEYVANIERAMGRYLYTTDKRAMAMVGVYIPFPGEPNYRQASFVGVMKQLQGTQVTVRVVEKKHADGYPHVDLVEIFQDGFNINKALLETGGAFLNEDHWDKHDKEAYRTLEQKAREQNLGVWKNQENLKVRYLRPKDGRFIHFPECKHVKDLPAEDGVEYFVPIPRSPFMTTRFAYFCDYCRPKFEEMMGRKK